MFHKNIIFAKKIKMKTFTPYILFLAIALSCYAGRAQDDNLSLCGETPVRFTEEMPEFPGGADSLTAFLQREAQYPLVAKTNGITGMVLIEFVVEKDGRVTHGKIKVPLFPDCDVEALRAVMSMPRWKPARNLGRATWRHCAL